MCCSLLQPFWNDFYEMNIWTPWMEIDDLLTKLALHAYWQNVWHEKWALLRLTICMTQLFLDLTFSQNYIYHTTFVTEWHVNLGEGVVSIRLIYVLMSWMNFTIHIHHTHLIWSLYCVFSSQSKGKVLEVQFLVWRSRGKSQSVSSSADMTEMWQANVSWPRVKSAALCLAGLCDSDVTAILFSSA